LKYVVSLYPIYGLAQDGVERQNMAMMIDRTDFAELDTRGLICPLPVLRARKVLLCLPPGAVLRVLADDPVALIDLPHFCGQAGHVHLGVTEDGGWQVHLIRRGAAPKAGRPAGMGNASGSIPA